MQPVPLPLTQNCLFTEGGGEDGLETEKKGCYDPSLHLSQFQHKSIDLLKRKNHQSGRLLQWSGEM